MDKSEYQVVWVQAMEDGTLVTFKHDPDSVGIPFDAPRTVLSHELANNLGPFLTGGQFDVREYENTDHPQSPLYIEVVPTDPNFSVPGSGIPAYGPTPTSACDRLVLVSGVRQGWHIYAEEAANIARKTSLGTLIPRNPS